MTHGGVAAPAFVYRTFSASGEGRLTVSPTSGLLRTQDHLVPVLDTIAGVFGPAAEAVTRIGLRVEGTDAVMIDLYNLGRTVLAARLMRGSIEAVVVAVAEASNDIGVSQFYELRRIFADGGGGVEWDGVMNWLTGCAPPLAAMVYLVTGDGDHGLDTVAMCVASEFFAAHATDVRDGCAG